jgi:hypothetical protein
MVRPIVTGWLTSVGCRTIFSWSKYTRSHTSRVELDDHRVVGVVQRDDLVALVGTSSYRG